MQVRITEKGRTHFGFAGDRTVMNVSDARAYAMMEADYAITDKNFMAMYRRNNPPPERETATAFPERKKRETATRKTKIEKAVEVTK